jgi:hypothetical protein
MRRTDLAFHLAPRYLSLPSILAHEVWSPKDKLLNTLSQLTRLTNYLDEILIYGHIELPIYLKSAGYRPDDRIFTVLRNPVGLVVSQANYVVSRIVADPEGNLPDAREWLGLLGLQKLPANPTDGYLKELAVRALYHPQLTQPNRICVHLSKGPNRDGASAIRHIVTHNIEVTDTENYNDWLKERWNVASITRHNQSTKFLDQEEILLEHRDQIDRLTSEDQKVFDVMSWAMRKTGAASIHGNELIALLDESSPFTFDGGQDEIIRRAEF